MSLAEQYKKPSNLDARTALHTRFSRNSVAWFPWVLDRLTLPEGARVLELGCGPAKLWRENLERIPDWNITLTDLSAGMVAEAEAHLKDAPRAFSFAVVNAEELPFDGGAFDAVVANHMLYHVPDLPLVLSEVRRVLKPDGRLFAATNGGGHMRELDDLSQVLVAGGVVSAFARASHLTDFTLETAPAYLEPYFSTVTLHRPGGDPDLYVTEAEPLIAYILSATPQNVREDTAKVAALRARVDETLAVSGEVRSTRATGLFEAVR